MNSELWKRVEEILDQALEVPEDERAALVEAATGGDPALRAEVERMLRACAASEGMLDDPPPLVARDVLDAAPEPVPELAPGTIVGQYRIVDLLGRGGMGAVFLAERSDGTFEKQVALKVVQRLVASDDTLRRFRSERRILARLEHPNIAGILDGGVTQDGRPYFVMELARGDAIDEHCDRLRLGTDARVRLFQTVCEAVQYAHGSLVVHRDLKPSNILVDRTGAVRLLDFGIAKVLDEEHGDTEGQTVGPTQRLTPEYAAPEQVTGEPTTAATDVYALGVVLYELLTGRKPYEIANRSIAGIARSVCFEEPPPPSERADDRTPEAGDLSAARSTTASGLASQLEGDLDAIVLKALEKDPARRYGSAAEFTADLRRYLEGRPVHARPATRWYRSAKFVRRYRTQVGATVVALTALTAGVIASTLQWRAAERERMLREREAERASLASDFLITTLQDLAPDRIGKPTLEPREVILVGMDNLGDLEATPDLRASVMNTLGQVSLSLSEYELADSLFAGALGILGDDDATEIALDRAESMTGLGYRFLRGTGDPAQAIPWFDRALTLRQQHLQPGDSLIAASLTDLGFAMYGADRFSEASAVLHQALALDPPSLLRVRTLDFLTNALARVATTLEDQGQTGDAADTLAHAHALGQEALALGEQSFAGPSAAVANVLLSLTQVALLQGDAQQSLDYADRSLAMTRGVFGNNSSRTAIALGWVAQAAEATGDLELAERSFREALATHGRVTPAWAWRPRLGLARVLTTLGRFDEAELLLVQSLSDETTADTRSEEESSALALLVQLYERWERPERARATRARLESSSAPIGR